MSITRKLLSTKGRRVRWIDEEGGGREIIADFVKGKWEFSEKEYGEIQWHRIDYPTAELIARATALKPPW